LYSPNINHNKQKDEVIQVKKKLVSILVAALLIAAMCFVVASAAGAPVTLLTTQTTASSSPVTGLWKYIDSTTKNNSSSTQAMKAIIQVRTNSLQAWGTEKTVTLAVGASAPYTTTMTYNSDQQFRLTLEPNVPANKGVSGTGAIYLV